MCPVYSYWYRTRFKKMYPCTNTKPKNMLKSVRNSNQWEWPQPCTPKDIYFTVPKHSLQIRRRCRRDLTLMTFVIALLSSVSLFCYLASRTVSGMHHDETLARRLLARRIMLNSCINIYIILWFDRRFRRFRQARFRIVISCLSFPFKRITCRV